MAPTPLTDDDPNSIDVPDLSDLAKVSMPLPAMNVDTSNATISTAMTTSSENVTNAAGLLTANRQVSLE